MELENIVANTVYLKARDGKNKFSCRFRLCENDNELAEVKRLPRSRLLCDVIEH